MPVEQQESLLATIDNVWLPAMRKNLKNKLKRFYVKCHNCGKYSKKETLDTIKHLEKSEKTIVKDRTKDAEVLFEEFIVEYYKCPFCGAKTEKEKTCIKHSWKKRYFPDK